MHKYKLTKILTVAILAALALTACAKSEEQPVPVYQQTSIEQMADLERDNFYMETKDGYIKPYWGEQSEDIVWFNENDWDMIPTLYKGDFVVYRTDQDFEESFAFTKYIDHGYTVGIGHLRQTSTGRCKYDATVDSGDLYSSSDAFRTSVLNSVVTFDKLDGKELLVEDLSDCGTIIGLEKDKEYMADLYVGTEFQSAPLYADSRALQSVQVNYTDNYQFIQAEIIRIPIPDYFKSGYYSVNGSGIFRYVNGEKYDDKTDFNEYNAESAEAAEQLENLAHYKTEVTENIEFIKPGKYTVTLSYDNDFNEDLIPDGKTQEDMPIPSAYINTGEEDIIYFDNKGNNTLETEYTIAEVGMYPLEISGLYGRGYSYSIEPVTTDK